MYFSAAPKNILSTTGVQVFRFFSFDRGIPDRNVLVFTATEEQATEAMEAGAYKTGDADLISEISKGRIDVVRNASQSCQEFFFFSKATSEYFRRNTMNKRDF